MRAMIAIAFVLLFTTPFAAAADQDVYGSTPPSFDGIGKTYMGREIAQVMGYEAADWLDRNEREQEEGTAKVIPLLGLKPTDVVADIGAGTGYFSFRLSKAVPEGKVYAEDIQPQMIAIIAGRKANGEGANVIPLQGTTVDPKLPPASIDLILLVDVYHEFAFPREMGEAMVRALKPGGRIAQLEYRAEDPTVPIKPHHKMSEAQARKEMAAVGMTWVSTDSRSLPWQHLMIFAKQAP